jgi:hypothetical protein
VNLEQRAEEFATEAHARAGQVRKYTGEPYIEHPRAVVALVRSVPHDEEMLAAAWLHDVVEDTGVRLDTVREHFGAAVAAMVEQLTDVSKPSDGNRAARKAIDREHTARAWPKTKTVKLADLIDNSRSILARDPEFAAVYLSEKRALLPLLVEGDAHLWKIANAIADRKLLTAGDAAALRADLPTWYERDLMFGAVLEGCLLTLEAERGEAARLRGLIDRDRTGLAEAIERMVREAGARMWVTEGRGPYAWDDERYKAEAGAALRAVIEVGRAALQASGDNADAAFRPEAPKVVMWGSRKMREGRCPPERPCAACDRLGKHLEPAE